MAVSYLLVANGMNFCIALSKGNAFFVFMHMRAGALPAKRFHIFQKGGEDMKRFITVLMSAMIALSMMPATAFAAGTACEGGETCGHVAAIGKTHYSSLIEAINAVSDKGTITILRDVNNATGLSVNTGKEFTVDFAGHTYTASKPGAGSTNTETNMFQLIKNQKITFKNGTLNCAEDNLKPATEGKNIKRIIQNYAELTLEDMTIDGSNQYGDGNLVMSFNNQPVSIKGNTSVILKNGATKAFDADGKWGGYDRCNVTVDTTGTIEGNIEVGMGYLNVISGNIGGISLCNSCGTEETEGQLDRINVTGGSFSSNPVGFLKTNDLKVYFKGEKYHVSASEIDTTSRDNVWIENSEGAFVETAAVAKIGDERYATLSEAISKVPDKGTITILRDVNNATGLSVNTGKEFTVDFAGHTYTASKPGAGSTNTETNMFQLIKNQKITFKNGTLNCAEDNLKPATEGKNIKRIIQNYAELTLEDMTIDGSNQYGDGNLVMSFNNQPVSIKGNTSVILKNGATKAFDADGKWGGYDRCNVTVDTTGTIEGNIEVGMGYLNVISGNIGGISLCNSCGTEETEGQLDRINVTGGVFSSNPKDFVAEGINTYHQHEGNYFVGSMPASTSGFNAWALQNGVYEETYVAPAEPETPDAPVIDNSGSGADATTNVDASASTVVKDDKAETSIDETTGKEIVENAKENNVSEVVIKAETEKGEATGSTVALPEATVQALAADDVQASVTIKTDNATVTLDKDAVKATAEQAGTDGEVKLVIETKEQNKNKVEIELKLMTSKGTVSDFKGGNVTVTVPVSEELASKKLVCVYIDENGKYTKMEGKLAADGKSYTFTTGHFSTYAILEETEADAIIAEQNKPSDIASAKVTGVVNKTYTGKSITQNPVVTVGESKIVKGTDYTVSYKNNVNAGVATLTIKGVGSYTGAITKTFKINPKGTSISKVTGQKKAVKVVWKKQLTKMKTSYVSGYQVQYSTSSKFTSGTSKYANAKFSKGRTTKTIKNLKSGKKYYVRVRTYKSVDGTKCYSSWSKAKSVKTK